MYARLTILKAENRSCLTVHIKLIDNNVAAIVENELRDFLLMLKVENEMSLCWL